MSEQNRDPEVHRLLDELPVPDHRTDFWASLDARLSEEATMTTTHTPRGIQPERDDVIVMADRRPRRWARAMALTAAAAALAGVVAIGTRDSGGDGTPIASPPSQPTTTISVQDSEELAATHVVDRFIDALGAGDTTTAAGLLGPRSEAYLTATTGSVESFLQGASAGYGAWATVPDRKTWALTVRQGEVVVVVQGTHPGEGNPALRADVFPVRHAESADAWFVEPWAFDPASENRLDLISPNPVGNPEMTTDSFLEVGVPAAGRVWATFDEADLSPVIVGRSDHGFVAKWQQTDLTAGRHTLVAVFENEKTFTGFARLVQVSEPPAP